MITAARFYADIGEHLMYATMVGTVIGGLAYVAKNRRR